MCLMSAGRSISELWQNSGLELHQSAARGRIEPGRTAAGSFLIKILSEFHFTRPCNSPASTSHCPRPPQPLCSSRGWAVSLVAFLPLATRRRMLRRRRVFYRGCLPTQREAGELGRGADAQAETAWTRIWERGTSCCCISSDRDDYDDWRTLAVICVGFRACSPWYR